MLQLRFSFCDKKNALTIFEKIKGLKCKLYFPSKTFSSAAKIVVETV